MKRIFDLLISFVAMFVLSVPIDEYYLKNRSFLFDLKILLMTFAKVVRREGVTH